MVGGKPQTEGTLVCYPENVLYYTHMREKFIPEVFLPSFFFIIVIA